MPKKLTLFLLRSLLTVLLTGVAAAAEVPFVNFEIHPVHAVDLSPDGRTLAVAHTADAKVQLFDVSEGAAVPIGHVAVGLEPVAVRFRTDVELWVANHLSDSISVVDIERRAIISTLATDDEPADIVFAAGRAFVSCSQANTVQVFHAADPGAAINTIKIDAEEPRAMTVNADGSRVFVAIFESGNGTTLLGGGIDDFDTLSFPPNVATQSSSPYAGQNPPPNAGNAFAPAINPALPPPPEVGLIVRKNNAGQWVDDNGANWSPFVSGGGASQSGRQPGWNLPDRDIAIIETSSLTVSYATRLLNIGTAIAYNPAADEITLVGTDASNEVRFEPNLNGRFLRVLAASVDASEPTDRQVRDLNPHLDPTQVRSARAHESLGDPRSVVWQRDGSRAFVVGMGSNNVIVVGPNGGRLAAPIEVGEGPNGAALDENHGRLYVWNHFAATLSTIDTLTLAEIDRFPVFNPLPVAITEGRRFLYDTQVTSGNGHVACGSCHVDARMDRLAWDLGDPSGAVKRFNQNCTTDFDGDVCEDFHPMKGPMLTQTLQDIVGHEPHHWRGDRDGLEEFNGAFVGLLGRDEQLTAEEMQRFEDFLATITFPPNPFRNLDNSLPTALELDGHFTTGQFAPAGQPLGTGNAVRGLQSFVSGALDGGIFHCANCHTLPTGMAVNGPTRAGGFGDAATGGTIMPPGPNAENHLGVVSIDGSTNRAIKVAQLRNLYEKVGFDTTQKENRAGFGFLHDGSIDSLARFVGVSAFDVTSDQQIADLVALMLAFSGSEFPLENPPLGNKAPISQDSHAAVGRQVVLDGAPGEDLVLLRNQAAQGRIDLIARDPAGRGYLRTAAGFAPADGAAAVPLTGLPDGTVFTAVPAGLGERFARDRDGDGIGDQIEIRQGSSPADPDDAALRPTVGLWYNPGRSGHGIDIELLGDFMFVTWYTYLDDGSPVWYQAAAPYAADWEAELNRFELDAASGEVTPTTVGRLSLRFDDASHATFRWSLGERSGTESFEVLPLAGGRTLRNYTGTWYEPADAGWGATFHVEGDIRVGVLYFYDADNQPRWVLGQSDNASDASMAMLAFKGFCPDCERVEPTFVEAGSLAPDFVGLRSATLQTAVELPDGSAWERHVEQFVPLSDAPRDPSVF